MACIQERFLIKSSLWWRAYSIEKNSKGKNKYLFQIALNTNPNTVNNIEIFEIYRKISINVSLIVSSNLSQVEKMHQTF